MVPTLRSAPAGAVVASVVAVAISTSASAQDPSSSTLLNAHAGVEVDFGEEDKTATMAVRQDFSKAGVLRLSLQAPLDEETREAAFRTDSGQPVGGFAGTVSVLFDSVKGWLNEPRNLSDAPDDSGLHIDPASPGSEDRDPDPPVEYEIGGEFGWSFDSQKIRSMSAPDVEPKTSTVNRDLRAGGKLIVHGFPAGWLNGAATVRSGVAMERATKTDPVRVCTPLIVSDAAAMSRTTAQTCSDGLVAKDDEKDNVSVYLEASLVALFDVGLQNQQVGASFGWRQEKIAQTDSSARLRAILFTSPTNVRVPLMFGVGVDVANASDDDERELLPFLALGVNLVSPPQGS